MLLQSPLALKIYINMHYSSRLWRLINILSPLAPQGSKELNFLAFKEIAFMMENKEHLTALAPARGSGPGGKRF